MKFDRLDRMISNSIDRTINDGRFRIQSVAQASPNGRRKLVPESVIEGICVFGRPTVDFGIELGVRKSYRESNDFRSISVGRDATASIDVKYFPDGLPKQGDRFQLLDKPDEPVFTIGEVRPDGKSRFVISLHETEISR
ncbi:conserved hypothetical protein [Roseibium sp. TrichSKD4]|uniref:hypothetical protein n=1 Tax=Roseibium sp. TrichSKD4 TaxID=744980 RepID=UPI0001E56CD3|nr:hypothetical protein [Roseibium sp. TrichSKD4]EFO32126.1 conserved hypothetical protein [Roseibium sp. TrichSKD4]